jgi:hypothetical protein
MAGSKRKSAPSSDFKRIKAKVGKKALKPLNDTDVSFKSASLHLGQSIQHDGEHNKSENRQVLLSSRGKSLLDLLSQLSHPAANARASSLKGMLDIVKNHPPKAILPNLSALIPACVHSCVDEDQDVRSLGIDILSVLLCKLEENTIQPFGALLIARVSSALHSLDASTRIDGVKMAKLVSTSCPCLTSVFVNQLLPPFSSLLADQRTNKAIDEILQSLVSLLRVTTTKRHSHPLFHPVVGGNNNAVSRNNYQEPDLIYVPNSSGSRNSILSTGRPLNVERRNINYIKRKKSDSFGSGIKNKTNLISKLRDSLVETINLEYEPIISTNKSTTIEPQGGINHARVNLLLRSIRHLHQNFVSSHAEKLDDDDIEFDKVIKQIASVLMDSFPINQDSLSKANVSARNSKLTRSVEDVNAAIAITILEVSYVPYARDEEQENPSLVLNDTNTKKWLKIICSYVTPRLKFLGEASNSTSSSSDLDITCKILRQHGKKCGSFRDLSVMLGILQETFCQTDDIQLARSTAGRRISLVVMDLIEDTNFHLGNDFISPISNMFTQFVMTMPFYLEAWAGDFLYESQRILEGLHKLVREVEQNWDSTLLECLRINLFRFTMDRVNLSSSIFEMYPWHMQKLCLGLMVLLRNPSDQTLKNLASICTRLALNHETCVKKEALVEAIIQAVQSIRKTVPMQQYLTFLVQSIGISSHVKELVRVEGIAVESNLDPSSKNVFDRAFFTPDPVLNIVARIFIQSGSMKVLRMIYPQLSSWQQTRVKEGDSSMEFLLKTRSSHIILAHFFLVHTKQKKEVGNQSSIFDTVHGAVSVDELTDSICRFIHYIVRNKEAMQVSSKLISPIVAIMSSEACVLNSVICKITDWFQTAGLSKTDQNNILLIFIDWMNDPRLKEALSGDTSSCRMVLEQIRIVSRRDELQDNEIFLNLVSLLSTQESSTL